MIDGYNRKIHYVRLSVTDLCNLKCQYCMPEKGICKKDHAEVLRLEEAYSIVKALTELGVDKVRLTGGEPLVRNGIMTLVERIAALPEIKDFSMTTNGILLEHYAKSLKEAGMNRINISLDTLDSEKFSEITRGGDLETVLRGIQAARDAGLTPIKLNVVVINGFNTDEVEAFIDMADEDMEVRFIELMPIGEAAAWSSEQFISNNALIREYGYLFEEEEAAHSGPARYYRKKNGKGRVGFINPISEHFCSACNRIRVTPDGFLKTCLHSNEEVALRPSVDNPDALKAVIRQAVHEKPLRHSINETQFVPITRSMHRIGG